jgi:glycerol-3-phosphate O-acyltransferase/dihydroxyacetone phosphate acyltransferase
MLIGYIERPISFLIAEKSTKRAIVGPVSRMVHAIPVVRAQDSALSGKGKITSEGKTIKGVGTEFKSQFAVGDQLVIGASEDPPSVVAVTSDTEMTVSHPVDVTEPTSYKVRIDYWVANLLDLEKNRSKWSV